jgi:hypothetical protein
LDYLNGWIRPDSESYRLSSRLADKLKGPADVQSIAQGDEIVERGQVVPSKLAKSRELPSKGATAMLKVVQDSITTRTMPSLPCRLRY